MRHIESRLRKLEAQLALRDQPQCRGIACVMHGVPAERRRNLAPDERIVTDWYRNRHSVTRGRLRITNDPADQGRKCKWGGYLLDVIEELHRTCSQREHPGSCWNCEGTPIAEPSAQAPLTCVPKNEEANDEAAEEPHEEWLSP